MATEVYADGILREQWDDVTQTYTAWDASGVQIDQRPYTAEEIASLEASVAVALEVANKRTIEEALASDLAAMQAVIDQTNADLRTDPSQEIKDIARAVRRLTRMALDDYTGTE